jgi:predicted RNA-binding Zn ribbon-like protein
MESTLTLEHSPEVVEDHARHGHQASLDDGLGFVNTLSYDKGQPYDGLTDAQTAINWLQQHDLLHQEMVNDMLAETTADPEAEDRLLQRIRRVRGALRELLDAAVEQRPPANAALREVNRALRAPYVIELVPASDGVSLDHRHEGDPISGALARLSEAIARELTGLTVRRLRICANDECRWVFNDHSPAGRRKWCDMSSCGNRAKAARHRARQKELSAGQAPLC